MGSSLEVLQGSYVYLLVFQILVVAFLLLFLLGLIVRRIKGTGTDNMVLAQAAAAAPPDEEMLALAEEQKEKIESLESELAKLEGATGSIKELQEKNTALQEKVKYLEQKLLEYEILQEEIGTLSYLKVENEKLRKQILQHSEGDKGVVAEDIDIKESVSKPETTDDPSSSLTQDSSPAEMTSEISTEEISQDS